MPEGVIELRDVSKRYGKADRAVVALDGLNLSVSAGSQKAQHASTSDTQL